jgi:hypothetical protein
VVSTFERTLGNLQGRVDRLEDSHRQNAIDIRSVNRKLDRIVWGMFALSATAGGHLLYLILTQHKP